MIQSLQHEVHIFVVNGRRVDARLADFRKLVLSKEFAGTIVGISILLSVFKNTIFGTEATLLFRILYWLANVVAGVSMWWGAIYVLARTVWHHKPNLRIPNFLITLPIVACLIGLDIMTLDILGLKPNSVRNMIAWVFFRNAVLALFFEFLVAEFLWPKLQKPLPETPGQAGGSPAAKQNIIKFGNKALNPELLMFANAVEHYVEFSFADRVDLVRVSFQDVVDRLCPDYGIQTHRSWWVSRSAVSRLERQNGKPVLILHSGQEVPVSRGRFKQVKAWVQALGDS